jgi:hypothetical protein
MNGFFDKMTGKTSKAEQAAAYEKTRQDEIERQREISRLAVEKAKSPEGQKWREDLQKQKIAEIEQDIRLRERQLKLFNNSSGETDPELLKLKRELEDRKNGVTSDFNLRLSELRNANPSSSMSMSNSNTSSLQMPMSTSMPKPSIPYNYDPFKPYKPKQPVGNDILNRQFRVPESFDEQKAMDEIQSFDLDSPVSNYKVPRDFDEEKAMQDLNEEDFDGGRRRRRTKRRISRNSKKSKKNKKSKKSRKSKKSKTIKY